jgi:O-antigen ligase
VSNPSTTRGRVRRKPIPAPSSSLRSTAVEISACGALALLLYLQILALGSNEALLAALAAFANIALALGLTLLLHPEDVFWRHSAPVWLLLGLALCWAALPGSAIAANLLPGLAAMRALRPAPDLLHLELVKLIGVMACALSGALIGYRRRLMTRTVEWIILLGLFYLLLAFALRQTEPDEVWGFAKGLHAFRFTGTLRNANAAGCIFGLIALLALGRMQTAMRNGFARGWHSRQGIICGTAALVALLAVTATALTGSRTSLVLTAIAFAFLIIAEAIRVARIGAAQTKWILLVLGGMLGFGTVALLSFGMPAMERFARLGRDQRLREEGWRLYADLAKESPWFGHGLGSFSELNLAGLRPDNVEALWNFRSAHNALLQMQIEGGLVFTLALVAAVAMMATASIRTFQRRAVDPVVLASIAAMGLIFGCAMVDIALNVPAIAALASSLGGLIWGYSLRHARPSRRSSRQFRAASLPARHGI